MSFRDIVRRLIARNEVDALDRGTAKIVATMDGEAADEMTADALRSGIDVRHTDLPNAVARRRAVR